MLQEAGERGKKELNEKSRPVIVTEFTQKIHLKHSLQTARCSFELDRDVI